MKRQDFIEFLTAFDEIIPFEASNVLAHLVIEDNNYDDSSIQYCIDSIEKREYLDTPSAEFLKNNPRYIPFIKGFLQILLLVDSDYREWMDEQVNGEFEVK